MHDYYWSNHFAVAGFQTWLKPSSESQLHCTRQLPKLAQLWKVSSAIHWPNSVRHLLGGRKSYRWTSNSPPFCILAIADERKPLYAGLRSWSSSRSACSQATAARCVQTSLGQNICVYTCWLMMDGCLCQITSVTRRTWQVAGWSHAQSQRTGSFLLPGSYNKDHHNARSGPGTVPRHSQYSEQQDDHVSRAQEKDPYFLRSHSWLPYREGLFRVVLLYQTTLENMTQNFNKVYLL